MMFYRGKRARKRTLARPVLLALSLVLVLGLSVGGTLAYLVTNSGPVTNTFTPGEVTTEIEENFGDPTVKKYVQFTNTGDVDVYIRATWTANWVDAEDNIVKSAQQGTDYKVADLPGSGWVKNGDYYYYTSAVKPGEYTDYLFTQLTPEPEQEPEGAHLEVTILSQAIQAEPAEAIKDAEWPVTVDPDSGDLSVNS